MAALGVLCKLVMEGLGAAGGQMKPLTWNAGTKADCISSRGLDQHHPGGGGGCLLLDLLSLRLGQCARCTHTPLEPHHWLLWELWA